MWDKRFGGTDHDALQCIEQTNDGGFILGGNSSSNAGGDKTQGTWGNGDIWLVKLDSLGNKEWDKNFGGTNGDRIYSLQQTSDGGYILGGWSGSGISGDKTQDTVGGTDFWIIKIDSLGNKLWDKDFGGTKEDLLYCVRQTNDGGYLLGGWSTSMISGDKTQNTWGGWDYWLVKTDSIGNKQWDKDLGGFSTDELFTFYQTADEGYILAGTSHSGISGDKSQNLKGGYDYWIVKIDSVGNKQWDKDFGGPDNEWLNSVQVLANGEFLFGGTSYSNIGGNKTQNNWGVKDFWLIKTDSQGNLQWDKDLGGSEGEEISRIFQTNDGGSLLSGDSYSQISGDKTENNLGQEQTWIIKIDSAGAKVWDKTIFTLGHDEYGLAIQLRDGCYLAGNQTYDDIGGYKTQASWGGYDYWIVKLCELPTLNISTQGSIFCTGTCTDFLNLSLNATSYQWSFPFATPDTSTATNPTNICYANPGSYDVQLIATNANGSDTLLLTNYITVYPQPQPQSITQSGDTLFAIAGAGFYQWYFNAAIISGATDYFYVAQASGDYNVVATDANGCEVEAAIFNVIANTLLTVDRGLWTIFPNPVDDKFTIHNAGFTMGTAVEISIYNVIGEMVLAVSPHAIGEGSGGEADVSKLTPGLYYIELTADNKILRSKFVKQ